MCGTAANNGMVVGCMVVVLVQHLETFFSFFSSFFLFFRLKNVAHAMDVLIEKKIMQFLPPPPPPPY